MPETGPRAPARTLVAVRATVPVTQMPPNRIETILPTPCALSSQFDRCLRPVMPSATTADKSDSMAPSSAIAMPSGNTACSFSRLKVGKVGVGSEAGIAPNRECTVATSIGKTAHTIAAIEIAIRNDGLGTKAPQCHDQNARQDCDSDCR